MHITSTELKQATCSECIRKLYGTCNLIKEKKITEMQYHIAAIGLHTQPHTAVIQRMSAAAAAAASRHVGECSDYLNGALQ